MRKIRPLLRTIPAPVIHLVLFAALIIAICTILYQIKADTDKSSSQMPLDAKLLLPEIIEHMTWTDGENVLDYGCGIGRVGYHFILPKVLQHNSHQYGVEYVRSNLEYAMTNFSHPRIQYGIANILADPPKFPFRHIRFHKIFAIYVFHLVPDLVKMLGRLKSLMHVKGQLGFSTLTEYNHVSFHICLRLSKMPKWRYYLRNYEAKYFPTWSRKITEDSMRTLIKTAGFNIVHLRRDTIRITIETVEKYIDSFFWLTPALEDVPISLAPDIKYDIRTLFTEMTGYSKDEKNFHLENEYFVGVIESV